MRGFGGINLFEPYLLVDLVKSVLGSLCSEYFKSPFNYVYFCCFVNQSV